MAFASGTFAIPLTGALLFAGGEIASVANPEGKLLTFVDVKLYVGTASTGAANINVGIAANGTTSASNLISALAINGSIAGKTYHGMTALAAKGEQFTWGLTQFLTATGSADSTGFVGTLFISYIRVT